MAFSSILSLALIQAILLTNSVSAANTISIQFSKPLADNSTDDYLLPLSIGSPAQIVYLTPSTNTDDTFAISPRACTPPGNTTPLEGCVKYRGGVFGPKQSSTYKPGKGGVFEWKDDQYVLFADGKQGEDTVHLKGDDTVSLKDFAFGLVDACNMTSAFLGLGPGSTLLARLVKDGKIGSRSYGLHVGIDIENHAYPILDPTFDESGEKPYDEADYNSGVGRLKRDGEAVREVHSFPGSLTLGGYDKSRIDSRKESLKAPITSDGKLELELTNMVVVNSWMVDDDPAHDVFNKTRRVVIDSSTPYMYLPESTAQELSYSVEAYFGDPLEDFFYGSSFDKYIGNVTFTLQVPGGGASIDIVIPPTVLYQPITALRDYIPVGDGYYDRYLPIKTFKDSSKQPIILGRTFLKAAYLYVNHDKNSFQISQVAYTKNPSNIVAVAATDADSSANDTDKPTSSDTTDNTDPPPKDERKPPIALIAAAAGGAGVFFALGVCFLLWRRRQSTKNSALKPIPSSVSVNIRGDGFDSNGMSGTPLVNLPPRDEKNGFGPGMNPGGQNWGIWEQPKDGNGGYYSPHPLSAGGMQYHEMESDHIGMPTSPSKAHPPQWAELPAAPAPAHSQQGPYGQQQHQAGPVPEVRYEMM